MKTHYRSVPVEGLDIFYRESGPPDKPAILLLHGFPSASHMFRDLIPELSGDYRVIAPDMPGFGQSSQPARGEFDYTFDNLARIIEKFTEKIGLSRYAIYVFDYGAPVGFRLAVLHPERITAVITQNGNAYLEGVSEAFNRDALRGFLTPQTTLFQYTQGVSDPVLMSPDGRNLDDWYLARPDNAEIQLDLFLDYQANVAAYPTIHNYLRTHQPPLLAVWGKHDPFFIPAGAEAFKRDVPNAEVRFFATGHFALETHASEIGAEIRSFLGKVAEAQSAPGGAPHANRR
jgi:pimeloyl-ACP methyl ester carboxylesterase